jgi:ABC-2 type transport system permease protein
VAISVVEPVIWLILFAAQFKRVVELPGFEAVSYVEFLAPGAVVITAVNASFNGMRFIEDMQEGVLDRLLVSPASRVGITAGCALYTMAITTAQTIIVLTVAELIGADLPFGGQLVIAMIACLLAASFAALASGVALIVRRAESLIAILTLITLPLTFLSSAFMRPELLPQWVRELARFNPVEWAVQASRAATSGATDWSLVAGRAALLSGLAVLSVALATLALEHYRRTL